MAGSAIASSPPFWPAVQVSRGSSSRVAPGISYGHYTLRTSAGPLNIHQLRLNLANPSVRVSTALANNRLISGDETVSSMMTRWSGAVAGVNGDFFDMGDSGMPLNIMVKDGRLLRSPSGWTALAIGKGGSARIAHFRWSASIAVPEIDQTYWIAGFNTGIAKHGITVLSNVRGYGAPVPDPGVRQTVVELSPAEASEDIGSAYTVKQVWPQQAFYAPFPKHEILLVGQGETANWLLRNITTGMTVDVNLHTAPDWRDFATIVGGGPLLVQNGRLVDDPYNPVPRERDEPNPVSAVGIAADGKTMLVVAVDGRQPRLSVGLTQPQLAAYMRWLGAYHAMEFDSGGSVTMALRLPGRPAPVVVNSPSDGHERAVANALLIFSMPSARSR
jgi:phosphodiester glycosidase